MKSFSSTFHAMIDEPPETPEQQTAENNKPEVRLSGKGWYYRGSQPAGRLPHFDDPDMIQFVTYRLADSLPTAILERIESELSTSPGTKNEAERERHRLLQEALDRGYGECWLRRKACAQIVSDCLRAGDNKHYELHAFTIMPNHVHVLARFHVLSMGEAVEQWKATSAERLNEALRRKGKIWQENYWDRYMRDAEHYETTARYIALNPVKARLVTTVAKWPWNYRAKEKWFH